MLLYKNSYCFTYPENSCNFRIFSQVGTNTLEWYLYFMPILLAWLVLGYYILKAQFYSLCLDNCFFSKHSMGAYLVAIPPLVQQSCLSQTGRSEPTCVAKSLCISNNFLIDRTKIKQDMKVEEPKEDQCICTQKRKQKKAKSLEAQDK